MERPRINVIDDDPSVLKSLARLLAASGFEVRTFSSAHEFLAQHDGAGPGCVIADLSMPGLDGLGLQQALAQRDGGAAMVFISGCGDVPSSVRAMKAGAVDFLTKPFDEAALLAAVGNALERDRAARAARGARETVERRLDTLTRREREVLGQLLTGRLNKQIAAELGTAEKTIKVHRARVLHKMGTRSVVELVRLTAPGLGTT